MIPGKREIFKNNSNSVKILKENKSIISIGEKNITNWNYLKEKLQFKLDCDFVEYLLSIAEKYLSNNPNILNKPVISGSKEITPFNSSSSTFESQLSQCNDKKSSKSVETINQSNKASRRNKLNGHRKSSKHIRQECNFESANEKSPKNEECTSPSMDESSSSGKINCQKYNKICRICDDPQHSDLYCPLNYPTNHISDCVFIPTCNGGKEYTFASLPCELEIRDKKVFSLVQIPYNTRLGPLVGVSIKESEIPDDSLMEQIWELSENEFISTEDVHNSNWMRWVRPAPSRELRNIVVLKHSGALYFVTIKQLNPGDELLYWAEPSPPWASKNMEKTSCGGCNISFKSPVGYRLHCSVFHEPTLSLTVRKYHCKVCGKPVLGKQNIINHATNVHGGKGAYQCQFCLKFFLRLNYLEMHRNYGCSSNPHRSRPLCHHCGKKFCQPQKLKVHIKRMHSDAPEALREFQCNSCLKLLGSRAALQRHFREVHKKPGGLSCSQCGKEFQNRSNLKIHMLTHSGLKPFKCLEKGCKSAFTTKQCLQFHYKKLHGLSEGELPELERSVEYTLVAYSGKAADDETEHKCPTPGKGESEKPEENWNDRFISEMPLLSKASRKWMGDLPKLVDAESKIEMTPLFNRNDIPNASLLVEAAIESAERDIGPVNVSPNVSISSLRFPEKECRNIFGQAENPSTKEGANCSKSKNELENLSSYYLENNASHYTFY